MNIDCIHARDVGLGDRIECMLGRYYRPTGEVCLRACNKRVAGKTVTLAGSRGLGDTVEKVIHTVTLGRVKPCGGCKKRRDWLNKLWAYKKRSMIW